MKTIFLIITLQFFALGFSNASSTDSSLNGARKTEICRTAAVDLVKKITGINSRPTVINTVSAPEKSQFGQTFAFEIGHSIIDQYRVVVFFDATTSECYMQKIEWIGDL